MLKRKSRRKGRRLFSKRIYLSGGHKRGITGVKKRVPGKNSNVCVDWRKQKEGGCGRGG